MVLSTGQTPFGAVEWLRARIRLTVQPAGRKDIDRSGDLDIRSEFPNGPDRSVGMDPEGDE
ncbi:hypothetical protein GCM10018780_60580 [Streptomyces lanatus]|nr:hypothetical protein GCM10018780_60580 [Streptomyces lanatus]